MSAEFKDLIALQIRLKKFTESGLDELIDTIARELTARLLAKVKQRTPVGQYPSSTGKTGGSLRRGWTAGKGSGDVIIHHFGDVTVVNIENDVSYAIYVEYGHRVHGKNGVGWVTGKFMLTISENEIKDQAPIIIQNMIEKELWKIFEG